MIPHQPHCRSQLLPPTACATANPPANHPEIECCQKRMTPDRIVIQKKASDANNHGLKVNSG